MTQKPRCTGGRPPPETGKAPPRKRLPNPELMDEQELPRQSARDMGVESGFPVREHHVQRPGSKRKCDLPAVTVNWRDQRGLRCS